MTLDSLTAALADRYIIERELGQGASATVYLAHDVKHDRRVAVKVLRRGLAAVIGADRFLAEIKTTANLQHPHILALFDSGEVEGTVFYVMPFIEGESLRARLVREKQLPIEDSLRIARQVAEALQYAHGHGIIHRDIKPENILLHGDHAMVADFGIALAASKRSSNRMTETGMSLGTPYYMSPEQALGERDLDARTDVYALGCVTYEMLTGEPPFSGPTAAAIVAKVLTEKPASIIARRDRVPEYVEDAVMTALQKLPADRFATVAEFASALSGDTAARAAARATVSARRTMRDRMRDPVFIAVGLAALGAAAFAVWGADGRSSDATPPPVVRIAVTLENTLAGRTSYGGIALSHDGSQLAYVSADSSKVARVYVRALNNFNELAIPGTVPVLAAAFSPSGESLALASNLDLWMVSVRGGTPRRLAASPTIRGLSWGEDNSIVFSALGALMRVGAADGRLDTLAVPAFQGAVFRNPTFVSRDLILFDISGDSAGNGLAAFSLKSGQTTRLGISGAKPILVNGHILVYFSADGTIWAVEFNTRSLKGSGPARRIGVGVSMSAFGVPRAAVAPNGTIVYAGSAQIDRRELVLVNRSGEARDIGGELRAYRFPRFSPDGQQIAVTLESTGGVASGDIWVLGLDGRAPLRLTTDSSSYQAEWNPDGASLIYAHRQPSAFALYRLPADGSGTTPTTVLTRPYPIYESRITPDHRTIVWREDNPKTLRDIMSAPLDSVRNIRPIVATTFDERGISMSPDGHWLAYVTNETGIDQVFIRSLEPQSPRWPISRSGGTEPRWSKTGELFFRRGDSVFVSRVAEGAVPEIGVPVGLFSGRYAATSNEPVWDVSPDGRQFAMVRIAGSEALRLTLFMNWAERWSARPQ